MVPAYDLAYNLSYKLAYDPSVVVFTVLATVIKIVKLIAQATGITRTEKGLDKINFVIKLYILMTSLNLTCFCRPCGQTFAS